MDERRERIDRLERHARLADALATSEVTGSARQAQMRAIAADYREQSQAVRDEVGASGRRQGGGVEDAPQQQRQQPSADDAENQPPE